VRYAPNLRASLVRAFTFTFFVSAIWSLLAVVAHNDMHQGALGYGILNGSLGVGAVIAAFTLARVRRRLSADRIIAISTAYDVFTLAVLALVHRPAVVIPTLVVAGFCWTSTMASLNTSVQVSVPAWVQARALGTYLMTFQGGMALGSVVWGAIADRTSTPTALLCAAGGFGLSFPIVRRFRVLQGGVPDTTPYQSKRKPPELVHVSEDDSESSDPDLAGPVRISIEYRVPIENYAEFTRAIHKLRRVRLRGGALRWGIYRDATDPTHLNETFITDSWLDYLRSRERVTAADERIRQQVWALHQDADPPRITYQVYAREVANPTPAKVS
jgi:MFS family permease